MAVIDGDVVQSRKRRTEDHQRTFLLLLLRLPTLGIIMKHETAGLENIIL
jgi:hypothetical protein